MKKYVFFLLSMCCTAASCADIHYGFIDVGWDGKGYLSMTGHLQESERIWLQWPDAQGKLQCCQQLGSAQLQEIPAHPSYEVSANDAGNIVNYLIQDLPQPAPDKAFIAIALSGSAVSAQSPYELQSQHKHLTASAKLCFGIEGINLIAQVNGHYDRLYLPLGYEIEASPLCTEDDFKLF